MNYQIFKQHYKIKINHQSKIPKNYMMINKILSQVTKIYKYKFKALIKIINIFKKKMKF